VFYLFAQHSLCGVGYYACYCVVHKNVNVVLISVGVGFPTTYVVKLSACVDYREIIRCI
jgi:hypothetical protein